MIRYNNWVLIFISTLITTFLLIFFTTNYFNNKIKKIYRTTVTYDVSGVIDVYNYVIIKQKYTSTFLDDIISWSKKEIYSDFISGVNKDDYEIEYDHSYYSPFYITFFIDAVEGSDIDLIFDQFNDSFVKKVSTYREQINNITSSYLEHAKIVDQQKSEIKDIMNLLTDNEIKEYEYRLKNTIELALNNLQKDSAELGEIFNNDKLTLKQDECAIIDKPLLNNKLEEQYILLEYPSIINIVENAKFSYDYCFIKQLLQLLYDRELRLININKKPTYSPVYDTLQQEIALLNLLEKRIENVSDTIILNKKNTKLHSDKYSLEIILFISVLISTIVSIILTLIIFNFTRREIYQY